MAGYWDLAAQQPGIMQNAGAAIANAIAATRESRQRRALVKLAQQEKERDRAIKEAEIAQRGEIERSKLSAATAEAEAERRANVQRYLAAAAQRGVPQEQLQAAAQRYGVDMSQPASLEADAAAVLGYQEPQKPEAQPTEARLFEWANDQSVSEDIRRQRVAWLEKQAKARSSTTNINANIDMPLTPSAKTKVQGDVMNADQRLRQLTQIGREIEAAGGHDSISSFFETGKAATAGVASRLWSGALSNEDRSKYGARAGAVAAMANFSNDIIKDLSGAAVNAHEWVRLRRSVPLPDDPGYVRAEKMRIWQENYAMIRAAGYENLAEGITAMQSQLKSYEPHSQDGGGTQRSVAQGNATQDAMQEAEYERLIRDEGLAEDEAYDRVMGGQ